MKREPGRVQFTCTGNSRRVRNEIRQRINLFLLANRIVKSAS
jgi:hypothetical protein